MTAIGSTKAGLFSFAGVLLASFSLAGCGGDDQKSSSSSTAAKPPASVEVVKPANSASGQSITQIDAREIFSRLGRGAVTVFTAGQGTGAASGTGLGSGFVISRDGEIVTNAHVVTSGEGERLKPAERIYVRFSDTNQVRARVIGIDPFSDIALLKINNTDGLKLVPLRFNTDRPKIGEPVVAIGSPFGEEQSVSIGVISAIRRSIQSLTGFSTVDALQTDAAINRGNSGGPLLNARGQVIGINSQIESSSGDGNGVGFAISGATARQSVSQLRKSGKVQYAYLGVSTVSVYPQLGQRFRLGTSSGAWVQRQPTAGPAYEAKVRGPGDAERDYQVQTFKLGGDVIVGINDFPIRSSTELAEVSQNFRPGQQVTLKIFRDGKRKNLPLTLGRRPVIPPKQ